MTEATEEPTGEGEDIEPGSETVQAEDEANVPAVEEDTSGEA